MSDPVEPPLPLADPPVVAIKLSPYQWSQVLKLIEWRWMFANVGSHEQSYQLFEQIATQLNGRTVVVQRPQPEAPSTSPAPAATPARKSWLKRFFA